MTYRAMENGIKKISNGEVKSVGLDGSMKVDTPAGIMTKYFICNKIYAKWLIDAVSDPKNAGKLPVPQAVLSPVIGLVRKAIGISD
jgi:hypothetical protein